MATFAPSAARRLAIAAPIPREPPVTSAIFPSSVLDIALLPILSSSNLNRLCYGPAESVRWSARERLPEHRIAALRLRPRRLVLNDVPMLGQLAVFQADDVDDD